MKIIESQDEFNQYLEHSVTKLVVIDFFATWCGPCQMIAEPFIGLATKYPDVIFAKIDVDRLESVSEKYGVTAMPTFMAFKNKEKIAQVVGASITEVEDMVKKNK